jgi:hypothetical protein
MDDLPHVDLEDLSRARQLLETPSLAIRIADHAGAPIEALVSRLPPGAQQVIGDRTRRALQASLDFALETLRRWDARWRGDWLHRGLVMASGAAGGALGLPGLLLELPFSLTMILRSIADNASAQGEDLSDPASRLECLTVFAYGTPSTADDAVDSAYFGVRAALARAVARATEYLAGQGAIAGAGRGSAPALVQLVATIAQRFGIALTHKAAAQLVPLLGAAGGAAVNGLFIKHYQDTAWAHFTVRRLERTYGVARVRAAYSVVAESS